MLERRAAISLGIETNQVLFPNNYLPMFGGRFLFVCFLLISRAEALQLGQIVSPVSIFLILNIPN